jgi:hypothetical protein
MLLLLLTMHKFHYTHLPQTTVRQKADFQQTRPNATPRSTKSTYQGGGSIRASGKIDIFIELP